MSSKNLPKRRKEEKKRGEGTENRKDFSDLRLKVREDDVIIRFGRTHMPRNDLCTEKQRHNQNDSRSKDQIIDRFDLDLHERKRQFIRFVEPTFRTEFGLQNDLKQRLVNFLSLGLGVVCTETHSPNGNRDEGTPKRKTSIRITVLEGRRSEEESSDRQLIGTVITVRK